MKKLIVERRWKEYLASRSRAQLKANARFAGDRRSRRLRVLGRPRPKYFRQEARIVAPEIFSFVLNPNGTVDFFEEMKLAAEESNIYVDLSKG